MISDEERREVARRLRMSRSEWSGMCWKLWLGPKFGAVVLSDGNRDELEDAAHRLADLIEPDCEEGRYEGVSTARPVDREALLALAEDVDGAADDSGGFEPLAGMLRDIARRIREALGVDDG